MDVSTRLDSGETKIYVDACRRFSAISIFCIRRFSQRKGDSNMRAPWRRTQWRLFVRSFVLCIFNTVILSLCWYGHDFATLVVFGYRDAQQKCECVCDDKSSWFDYSPT